MSGVAEEDNAAFVPVPHRIAVHHRTAPAKVHHGVQGAHRRMSIAVNLFKLGAIGCNVGLLGVSYRPIHRHDVELSSVAQRVMDNVIAGSSPQHDAVTRDVNFKLLHWHYGSQRGIAAGARFTVTDEFLSEKRANTVRGDEGGTRKCS